MQPQCLPVLGDRGGADPGAAWLKPSEEGPVYRSVDPDNPSFGRVVDVTLVEMDKVETMIWSPSNGSRED